MTAADYKPAHGGYPTRRRARRAYRGFVNIGAGLGGGLNVPPGHPGFGAAGAAAAIGFGFNRVAIEAAAMAERDRLAQEVRQGAPRRTGRLR